MSILKTVKAEIPIPEDNQDFDKSIITHINSALFILYQIGYCSKPYSITGYREEWEDFFPNINECPSVKLYVSQKVKLVFDPPINGSAKDALEKSITELESRINWESDY